MARQKSETNFSFFRLLFQFPFLYRSIPHHKQANYSTRSCSHVEHVQLQSRETLAIACIVADMHLSPFPATTTSFSQPLHSITPSCHHVEGVQLQSKQTLAAVCIVVDMQLPTPRNATFITPRTKQFHLRWR